MAYARFLIPKLIPENRVLYLDSDIVVDKPIDELFRLPFNGNLILAAHEYASTDNLKYMNDGVMVINNKQLKKIPNISEKLINLGRDPNLPNGDQTVVNDYFKGKIGKLPDEYNYSIGFDAVAFWNELPKLMHKLNSVKEPKIIHYVTVDKPFNFQSIGRMREKWWFYRNLELSKIVQKYTEFDDTKIGSQHFSGQVFIFTQRAEIKHLEELIQKLPDVCFNVALYTDTAFILTELVKYPNFKLYTNVIEANIQRFIDEADVYLDINFGPKETEIVDRIKAHHTPILTFNYVSDGDNNYQDYTIFDDDDVSGMASKIREIIKHNTFNH
ncbi:MAG: family 8 glycosyl transferase [Lactobacillus sp.]|nr:family 8 glycosyl transferase [Lactobacillus sp.]